MIALSPIADPARAQHFPPAHEWAVRHIHPIGAPPLNDEAVGSGTNGTHIFSVYAHQFQEGASVFQLVKYDTGGNVLAEQHWPDWDEAADLGRFNPRAMKVVHTQDIPPRTDIFVAGDIPEPMPLGGRRIVVMSFDQNLKMRWMWTHYADDDGPPNEQLVALDATEYFVAAVGRVGQRWMTVVFNRSGAASIAMPPQYTQPGDPDNWPVSVSLTGSQTSERVAILGGPRWFGPAGSGLMHAVQFHVSTNPIPYSWFGGFGGHNVPVAIKTTGDRLYVTGYGYDGPGGSPNEIYFNVHDIPYSLDWTHTYNAGVLDNIVHGLVIKPGAAPPQTQGGGWDAFAWITGGKINVDGSMDAVTIQYRDLGVHCDPWPNCSLVARVDWVGVYSEHVAGRAEGVHVLPRSDFTGDNNDLVYVAGVHRDGENNWLNHLLLGYTAQPIFPPLTKEPVWDEIHPSHAGDIDWPVSFVEHPHLGGPNLRRLILGLSSVHPQQLRGMVTSLWCHNSTCDP